MTCINVANIINEWIEQKLVLPFRIDNDVIQQPTGDAACLRHDPAPAAEKRFTDGSRLVKWNLTYYIRSSNRNKARQYAYDITDALDGAIVGGRCILNITVAGQSFSYPLCIRGKNPLDQTALTHINSCVDEEFQSYAWMIAKHESKSGSRVYNQFNPNKTTGANTWGWGIAQIDKGEDGDTTAEVYDWHENVASMNAKLRTSLATYNRFVGYYRSMYANNAHWVEPDEVVTTIDGYVVSAKMWSVLTFYNGVGGCPQRMLNGSMRRTPIEFDPEAGQWVFHANSQNYVTVTVSDRNALETE